MRSFSPKSTVELVRAFRFNTHAQIHQFALEFSLLDALGEAGLEKKETRLMEHLVAHPHLESPRGGPLMIDLIERVLKVRCERSHGVWADPSEEVPELVNALKQDGYIVSDYRVRPLLPEAVPLATSQDELFRLLERHGFTTARGHLEQTLAAHARGDWAAANAQLRSFLEDLFDSIAEQISGGESKGLGSSHARREWLARCTPPFFETNLNEWEVGGSGGFVQGLWRRLHPEGSHPGLSSESDSTFRLHTVLIVAQHFLERFDRRAR